jgi:peptide/nickel transport system substrate-binding protein/oligopeptide transport system substrate-binding protein
VGVPTSYLQHFLPGQAGDSGLDEAIWTPLTTLDPHTGKVVDAVAQSLDSSDQQHWTIKLRTGWTFHNGEPVTAQSFADSWNATAYGPNAMGFNYLFSNFQGYAALNPAKGKPATDKLSGVTVVDAHTLKVTLTSPLSTFPYILAGTSFAPMPKAAFSNLDAFDKQPIGDGPYQVAAPGIANGTQELTLNRYKGYAGAKGNAATITVKAYQNDSTAFTSFQAGAVDIATVSGNDLSKASSAYHGQVVTTSAPAVVYLGFPLWDKRFTDPRVREAFSLAVDRNAIVKALLDGFGDPATGVLPKTIAGGGQADCGSCAFDPAKAKQLLAEAGGWSGSLTLWTKQDATMQTVLQAVLDQLRTNLGITSITLQSQPLGQIYSSLGAHKVDGPFLLYTGASYPNAYSLVDELFSAGSATNVTGFNSPAFTQLLAQAAKAGSPDQSTALVQQASRTAMSDLPLTPVYHPVTGLVHSTRLSDVAIDYLGDADLATVSIH